MPGDIWVNQKKRRSAEFGAESSACRNGKMLIPSQSYQIKKIIK